jgi:NosR/NirI family nitrous oxide reductase transcriptional regulator
MKRLAIVLSLLAATVALTAAQNQTDARLKRLFPAATTFSPKAGDPPHVKAYNGETLLGYAFWTTEILPLERAYGGPIAVLVGMDTKGILSGIVIVEHHEPYGDFSIDPPGFAAQFKGKDVRDPFKLGEDIDAVSRATITMSSAVRTIRNSSRRIARAYLTPPSASPSR